MNPLKTYTIQYVGLPEGNHSFKYHINNPFLALFEHDIYKDVNIDVMLQLNKHDNLITLLFNINGNITTNCDICLDNLIVPVAVTKAIIVKPAGTNPLDADQDEVIIAQNDTEINIAQHIYDFITLSIPLKNVHPLNEIGKPTCNAETLKEIQKHLTGNNQQKKSDPRWDKLKKLS